MSLLCPQNWKLANNNLNINILSQNLFEKVHFQPIEAPLMQ